MTYAEQCYVDPFAPLHWRWQVAGSVARGEAEPTDENDPALRVAIRLRTHMERGEQADSADRLPKDILEAHSIYEEDGLRRWELEARILAGQDDEKIARCCRVTTDVVSAYEQVFYNVRDSFDASDYLLCEALRYKPCVGFDAGDVRYFWAWVALDGEGLALDEVIVAFKKAYRPGEVVTLAVYLDDSVPVKLQGLVATMLLPVDSPAWQLLGSRSVAKTILGLDHGGFSIDRLRAKIVRAARAHAP